MVTLTQVLIVVLFIVALLAVAVLAGFRWRDSEQDTARPKEHVESKPGPDRVPGAWVERARSYDNNLISEDSANYSTYRDILVEDNLLVDVTPPGKNGHGPH